MFPRYLLFLPLFLAGLSSAQMPPPLAPPAAPKPPDHSQEPYVIEKLRNAYRFAEDGTGRHEVYARIKVQSEAGVEQWGQLVVGYNSANERLDINFVRVLKASGSVVTAPQDAVQD